LEGNAGLPVVLAGCSWGAMLSFIFASRYLGLVKKLILIGSGVYKQDYVENIMETRLSRLNEDECGEALSLIGKLEDTGVKYKDALLARFGLLIGKADFFDSLPDDSERIDYSYEIYRKVWEEAEELRRSGKLLEMGREIRCPVVAIHGDYDPHPYEGVRGPLSSVLKDFQSILLENSGHKPWIERQARERFYNMLRSEIDT
jgi:pimeloyl-ACP methyl ester carboxylesterase